MVLPAENPSAPFKKQPKESLAWQFLIWPVVAAAVLITLLCYLFFVDCSSSFGRPSCTRVFFIGNSFTFVNDLPGTFVKLARSGGHKVETDMSAPGGWTLEQHFNSQETLAKLNGSQWDYVILQEQSLIPASPEWRSQSMYPAARSLVKAIRSEGAEPIFFVTWGHEYGWPEMGLPDYESMQNQIDLGYQTISQELNVVMAPVGYSWMLEHRQNPLFQLWNNDGYHPEPGGTYLTACVFYVTIFRQSPVGLKYFAGLPAATAKELQLQAAQAVLGTR